MFIIITLVHVDICMGNCSFGRSAAYSRGNVVEFYGARVWSLDLNKCLVIVNCVHVNSEVVSVLRLQSD